MSAEDQDQPAGERAGAAPLLSDDPRVHSERYVVRSYEIDPRGRLQIAAILCYLQETAAVDVLARGFSDTDLLARRDVWVLARLALEVDARPGWRQELTVHTWAAGVQGRLLARREFLLENAAGAPVARAASAWLYIDAATRRPRRVDQGLLDAFPVRSERALDQPLDKLPPPGEGGEVHRFAVRFRDLDVNQHVNNSRYLEFIMSSLPPAVRDGAELAALELNFLAEARLGDQIEACCRAAAPPRFEHSVRRASDGRELVRARSLWRPAAPSVD